MNWILGLFVPGKRTITLSVIAGLIAVLLQADAEGFIHLIPMLKLTLNLGLTVTLPLIPIYLRKGIQNSLNETAKK
jgi:hypothetical protein